MSAAKKTRRCGKCGKDVDYKNFARHRRKCKGDPSVDAQVLSLTQQLLDAREENKALMEENKALLERCSALELQVATATSTTNTTNNYYQIFVSQMEPWCIDPAADGYRQVLGDDVRALGAALRRRLRPQPRYREARDYRASADRANRLCELERFVCGRMAGPRPRYVVTDLARKKGVFKLADGAVRFDAGMQLLMSHQARTVRAVQREHGEALDWWYGPDEKFPARLRIAAVGHAAARRLQKEEE